MKIFIIPLLLFACLQTNAQDKTIKELRDEAGRAIKRDPEDTIPQTWKTGALYNLALTQGSLSNWAAGGDNFSLSVNSIMNLYAFYKKDRHSWDNMFDFNLGYVQTTSLGGRKNDDRIDLLSKYGFALNDQLNLAGLFNLRSQLFNGFTYDDEGQATLSSSFLSPAYIMLSPGLDYKPSSNFSLFASPITTRWVIVRNEELAAKGLYGVRPGRNSNLEVGAFLTANYIQEFSRTVSYRGRVDLFSNYRRNPKNVDLFMTHVLALKISRLLSFSWNVDMIYDDDVRIFGDKGTSAALQVKSLVGAGLLLKVNNLRKPRTEASE